MKTNQSQSSLDQLETSLEFECEHPAFEGDIPPYEVIRLYPDLSALVLGLLIKEAAIHNQWYFHSAQPVNIHSNELKQIAAELETLNKNLKYGTKI